MSTPRSTATLVAASVLMICVVACGGDGTNGPSPTGTTRPSELTRAAAATAVDALCRMASIRDVDEANATFYDDAHATLHTIARQADADEIGSSADLLISMQRVEAELEEPALPPAFRDDIRALRLVTAETLEGIDVPAPGC